MDLIKVHLIDAKHVLRYLKGIVDYELRYDVNQNINSYVDSYWGGSSTHRKSTLGCFFILGSSMISRFNRKQSCVAPSIAEAEYVVACSASCKEVWMKKIMSNLFNL